jgi:hypothetical protein
MSLFSRAARTVLALARGRSGVSLLGYDGKSYALARSGSVCYLLGLWIDAHHELFFMTIRKIKARDKSQILKTCLNVCSLLPFVPCTTGLGKWPGILDALALSLCKFFGLIEVFSQRVFNSLLLLGEWIGIDVSHQFEQLPSLVGIPIFEINLFFNGFEPHCESASCFGRDMTKQEAASVAQQRPIARSTALSTGLRFPQE